MMMWKLLGDDMCHKDTMVFPSFHSSQDRLMHVNGTYSNVDKLLILAIKPRPPSNQSQNAQWWENQLHQHHFEPSKPYS